ncbi:hypothetical protein SORBI_3008G177950 [Sorghum bicolor]|uniref:Uncharacterized protein n=1 Tax=Sorghum bicolor TaxID=4558 RepID=A0A1Z5R7I6_SORBI|nr:hypothetical protein SORBI_3008G177950 [Sorghum bicolor]
MEMEGGGLGFARVDMAARLLLWSMEVNPNGGVGWTRTRVIELEKLLPVGAGSISYGFLGFAHGVDVFFVGMNDGVLFSFDLKSGRVRKVYKGECDEDGLLGRVPCVVPYTSFCTPGSQMASDLGLASPGRRLDNTRNDALTHMTTVGLLLLRSQGRR